MSFKFLNRLNFKYRPPPFLLISPITDLWASWDGTTDGSSVVYDSNATDSGATTGTRINAVVPLDSTRILVFYKDITSQLQEAVVLSHDSTTLTAGTPVQRTTGDATCMFAETIDADTVIICFPDYANSIRGTARILSDQ